MTSFRFTVPPENPADAILASFSDTFGTALKPVEAREEHYLDSFDWRLYDAGLLLCISKSSRRTICLMDRDTRETIRRTPLRGRRMPRFSADFTDPGLKERLADILWVRAADPVVSVAVSRQPFALLDSLQKTVVRGALEYFTRAGANTPFMALLTLSAVRGYDKSLEKAKALALSQGSINETEQNFLVLATQSTDRKPGDYSSKLELPLDPDMTEAQAAASIFSTLADAIEQNIPGTCANADSEFLHDLRVAVRRTRSALSLLKPAIPSGAYQHFAAEFSWLGKETGPLRDLDVYLLAIDDYDAALPDHMHGALEPFRKDLMRRHRRESKRLCQVLQSPRMATLLEDWRDLNSRPHHWQSLGAQAANQPIKNRADQRIWKTFRVLERDGSALDDTSPAEAFHALRKHGKKMRYALEFFRSLYPESEIKPLIKDLKAVQQVLGDYQDYEVQAGDVERFATLMAKSGKVPAETLLAMGTLVGELMHRQADARTHFAEAFGAFASKRNQKIYKTLFKPVREPKDDAPAPPTITITVES